MSSRTLTCGSPRTPRGPSLDELFDELRDDRFPARCAPWRHEESSRACANIAAQGCSADQPGAGSAWRRKSVSTPSEEDTHEVEGRPGRLFPSRPAVLHAGVLICCIPIPKLSYRHGLACRLNPMPIAPEPFRGNRIAPGDKARNGIAVCTPSVNQRSAVRCGNDAARRDHDRMSGSDVPFVSRSKSRIDINAAFGYPAEFQG